MQVITLEEHFITPGMQAAIAEIAPSVQQSGTLQEKLLDLGDRRLAEMDAGGVDLQVLSLASSGFEVIDSMRADGIVQDANDRVADAVRRHPTRFAALANVNLKNTGSSVKELERCIKRLGFRGVIAQGTTGGGFLDQPRFLSFWEAAAALGIPVYLHPAPPPAQVYDVYYDDLPGESGKWLSIAGWGWHTETGLHVLRLILSGLFDRFPSQQVIIGHMGEDLPYSLARAASVLTPVAKYLKRSIPEYFHDNIHVTTSGYFTNPPFACALEVVGIDRLLYSIDYPFSPIAAGNTFLEGLSLSDDDRLKFAGGNARKLLNLLM